MAADREAGRRRVVIVGGGFGGIAAAKELRRADVDLTVVDRMNHQLFQPLLYQMAAGGLSAGDIASPIRTLLKRQRNASVLMAEVTDLDVEGRSVLLDTGERLDYDNLIVACGAETSYFGHDELAQASLGLKTLSDAIELRDRIYGAFEQAERTSDEAERDKWLTFVVVGGGPTGVEISGQLALIATHGLKREFSRIDPTRTRVILIDAGERVVSAFSDKLSAKAAKGLSELGVTVREHGQVTSIDPGGVSVETDGQRERIAARTVVWAAGVQAVGLTRTLAEATGASADRAGRIEIEPDLSIPGHSEISVIGDASKLAGADGNPLPGLATAAIQQGRHVAKTIRRGSPSPFKYRDKGALAVIGRGKAVCQIRNLQLSGRPAFAMYLGIHLYYLSGVAGRRINVLNAWASARFGSAQQRVVDGELPDVRDQEPSSP